MQLYMQGVDIYKEGVEAFITPISISTVSPWVGRLEDVTICCRLSSFIYLLTSTEQKILRPFLA